MQTIPFGVSRLDSVVGGGAPSGNVVLLAGEPGAGAREFLYTSIAMNELGRADPELFDLHYGEIHENAVLPPETHYLSLTADRTSIERELLYTLDEPIVDAVIDRIHFRDFSPEYFQVSQVPRSWYVTETERITDLGTETRQEVLPALGSYLSEHAAGNLVVLDAITDLIAATSDDLSWADIGMLVRGLQRASRQWDGLILLLVNHATLEATQLGDLMEATGGTFRFEWKSGGSKRARTMVVESFRGILSRLEAENIVRFETQIHDGGFDISDVRKIR
ncbi:MAG: RAD55 family ATPase [Halobacteriota archaeon]